MHLILLGEREEDFSLSKTVVGIVGYCRSGGRGKELLFLARISSVSRRQEAAAFHRLARVVYLACT